MLLANQIKIAFFCSAFSWQSLFYNYIFLIKWLQLIMKVFWCYYTVSFTFNYLTQNVWHISSLSSYLGLSSYVACTFHVVIDTCLCIDIQILLSNKISFIYTQKLVVTHYFTAYNNWTLSHSNNRPSIFTEINGWLLLSSLYLSFSQIILWFPCSFTKSSPSYQSYILLFRMFWWVGQLIPYW